MTKEVFDKIYYEDTFFKPQTCQATFWFKAPTDILNGSFPDADEAEIMIETTAYGFDARTTKIFFSPCKYGDSYYWYPAEMTEEEVRSLLDLAKSKEKRWQV